MLSAACPSKLNPVSTGNAEIVQPYFLVACATSEKEIEDETENAACHTLAMRDLYRTTDYKRKTLLVANLFCIEESGLLGCCAMRLVSFETSGSNYPNTRRNNPENLLPQQ